MNKKLCREIQKRNKWQIGLCGLCRDYKDCQNRDKLKGQDRK